MTPARHFCATESIILRADHHNVRTKILLQLWHSGYQYKQMYELQRHFYGYIG